MLKLTNGNKAVLSNMLSLFSGTQKNIFCFCFVLFLTGFFFFFFVADDDPASSDPFFNKLLLSCTPEQLDALFSSSASLDELSQAFWDSLTPTVSFLLFSPLFFSSIFFPFGFFWCSSNVDSVF